METRPTTDRVKEGLFNALQFRIQGRRVLDLFAGTGQLGIECLSRGASSAVFVDHRADAVSLIRRNLDTADMADRAVVTAGDALSFLAACEERFGLIFLDPPYGTDLLERALEQIAARDLLIPGGWLSAEHPADHPLPEAAPPCRTYRTYRYGKIAVTLFRRDGEGDAL